MAASPGKVAGTLAATAASDELGPCKAVHISITGTWAGSVVAQRSLDNGTTWVDIPNATWTANIETQFQIGVRPIIFRLDWTRVSGSLVYTVEADDGESAAVGRHYTSGDPLPVSAAVASIAAGTAYLGQVASPIQYVDVLFTVPTDAQDSGDVLADTQVVTNATRANDVPAILHSVTLIDTDDQKVALSIILFDANTSLGTEDSAPDIDDTEALTLQGEPVEIAVANYKDLGGAAYAGRSSLGILVKPATGTRNIYAALMLGGAGATYASGIIKVRFGFLS